MSAMEFMEEADCFFVRSMYVQYVRCLYTCETLTVSRRWRGRGNDTTAPTASMSAAALLVVPAALHELVGMWSSMSLLVLTP